MTTAFSLSWPNADLSILPNPEQGWHRVAVIHTSFAPTSTVRKRWPKAAVVGPCRTLRGIDLLVRGLLANPQIRVLVIDNGAKATEVNEALSDLWIRRLTQHLAEDLHPHVFGIVNRVLCQVGTEPTWEVVRVVESVSVTDRPGGAIILPPPVPEPTAPAPHGDPGTRVVGDTLADVWPQVLKEVLLAGSTEPTHYGDTKEIRSLISVIRDPAKSCADIAIEGHEKDTVDHTEPHPVLGFTFEQLEEYTKRLTTNATADGASYSYGTLLSGSPGGEEGDHVQFETPGGVTFEGVYLGGGEAALWINSGYVIRSLRELIGPGWGQCVFGVEPNQIANLEAGLAAKPGYRGHYLTPWIPDRFSDPGAKGKPCLVGIQFRASRGLGSHVPHVCSTHGHIAYGARREEDGTIFECAACRGGIGGCVRCGKWEGEMEPECPSAFQLHATVTFRSHDMYAAYPQNLAAVCLWLTRLAQRHGMQVGTVVCHSVSAHLYARDWEAAQEVVDKYRPPVIRWDQRSSWRITATTTTVERPCSYCRGGSRKFSGTQVRYCKRCNWTGKKEVQEVTGLRAEALSPDGRETLAVFEAPKPGALRLKIERSRLVTEVGAALWLGSEIDRVWREG